MHLLHAFSASLNGWLVGNAVSIKSDNASYIMNDMYIMLNMYNKTVISTCNYFTIPMRFYRPPLEITS